MRQMYFLIILFCLFFSIFSYSKETKHPIAEKFLKATQFKIGEYTLIKGDNPICVVEGMVQLSKTDKDSYSLGMGEFTLVNGIGQGERKSKGFKCKRLSKVDYAKNKITNTIILNCAKEGRNVFNNEIKITKSGFTYKMENITSKETIKSSCQYKLVKEIKDLEVLDYSKNFQNDSQ